MRILWFCLLLQTVFAEYDFGTSYLGNSKLCHQWTCLNTKLGLSDNLPPRDQYSAVLRRLLPEGPWQDVVDSVVHVCYDDRPRTYTTTCPGQALMHCVVEQLIQNCPEQDHRKNDACSPVSSLAGFKYMFSQSLYMDIDKNWPKDRRPEWFLKNYFNTKCCNFPQIFNASVLSECEFSTFLYYYMHGLPSNIISHYNDFQIQRAQHPKHAKQLNIVELNAFDSSTPTSHSSTLSNFNTDQATLYPLDCCEMSEFIQPSWRSECGFNLRWDTKQRLVINSDDRHIITTTPSPTTTVSPVNDIKVVPQTCEKVECVFKKLNIVSETGSVDVDGFSKFLDNMSNVHPEWNKAKARAVTICLSKPVITYEADCEINKVLACVLDVLSENCPFAKKIDSCKHSLSLKDGISCQISSSKLRPKNRRQFCGIPSLVNHEVLSECHIHSLSHMEYVKAPRIRAEPKKHSWSKRFKCKELTESTTCVMNKMGVLNKYGFLDHFRMKYLMNRFTTNDNEWSPSANIYVSAFIGTPMYQEHCNSPKKLLNVLDSMLMTCPVSKRKRTEKCDGFFASMESTKANSDKNNITKEILTEILGHHPHVFLPNHLNKKNKRKYGVEYKPKFDFGLFGQNPPPVRIIDVKSKVTPRKSLILLPVYARMSNSTSNIHLTVGNNLTVNLSMRPVNGLFRGASYLLRNRVSVYNLTTPRTTFEFDNKL